jgi:hypothetical protein
MHTGATWKSANAVDEASNPLVVAGADCAPPIGFIVSVVVETEVGKLALLELGGEDEPDDVGVGEETDTDGGDDEEAGGNESVGDGGG